MSMHSIFSQGYITVHGKGNKERIVPLPEHLMQFIEYYLEEIYPQLLIKMENTVPLISLSPLLCRCSQSNVTSNVLGLFKK